MRTEGDLLLTHLRHWMAVLDTLIPDREPALSFTVFPPSRLRERVSDTVLPGLRGLTTALTEDGSRTHGAAYYTGAAVSIGAVSSGGRVELGDGGFTDWTARLTENSKERCLVTCLATERLLALIED